MQVEYIFVFLRHNTAFESLGHKTGCFITWCHVDFCSGRTVDVPLVDDDDGGTTARVVVNMWGDCGHLLLHYSIVCGLCNYLLWSSQAGGFLYHITVLGLWKRWYCCFSLIDGEGFVTWDLERGSDVAWWCWLPYGCVLVIMWILVHVCPGCCEGHWHCVCTALICEHCVSTHSITVCTWITYNNT